MVPRVLYRSQHVHSAPRTCMPLDRLRRVDEPKLVCIRANQRRVTRRHGNLREQRFRRFPALAAAAKMVVPGWRRQLQLDRVFGAVAPQRQLRCRLPGAHAAIDGGMQRGALGGIGFGARLEVRIESIIRGPAVEIGRLPHLGDRSAVELFVMEQMGAAVFVWGEDEYVLRPKDARFRRFGEPAQLSRADDPGKHRVQGNVRNIVLFERA